MLSIGKLGPGQQAYYLDTVARGAEEYFTGAKEAPGQWMGRAAELLGLSGEVDGEDLHRVLDHRDPLAGTRFTRAQGAPKVPGFDATFCAPKSVSLLFALGLPDVSNEVRNGHDRAVAAALDVLEAEAARARRGKAGAVRIEADGFVAAAFRHRTSRAGDPHLHTHVVVANLVQGGDGRWSALDARPFYAWAKTAGYLYEAQLRMELTRRLGLRWNPVCKGIADITGVPRSALREFSRRREEIVEHMAERGETSARAAQVATYATRRAKDSDHVPESLLPEWRQRADAHGLDADALHGLLDRHPAPVPSADNLFAHLAGHEGLTAQVSTFGRREVIQGICAALPAGGDVGEILDLADAFLTSEHVVALGAELERQAGHLMRRLDGGVVPAHLDEDRFTTREMLATEEGLIASAVNRVEDGVGIVASVVVDTEIAMRPSLSEEQAAMVRHLAGSGRGVDVVVGVAGSGKTFALAAARAAWIDAGYQVVGTALAARAAVELQAGSGIPSVTLDRLLGDLDRPDSRGLPARTVVVVDEAAMVGTRRLARLLAHAAAAQVKVVLIGDHRQLPEIEAGGAFAGLARRLGPVTLRQNRRQIEVWERAALAHLRHGDVRAALAVYQAHGRIHAARSTGDVREQLVDDWWAARQAGGRQLMIAARHTDVDDLNRRARTRLIAAGVIDSDQMRIGNRSFAIGDEILALRNDYRLGVLNGTRAEITALDWKTGDITARTDSGTEIVLPYAYVEAGHLTHGYATTLHKAQGATFSQAFVLADDTVTRQRGYSALSRGSDRNDLYAVAANPDEERHSHGEEPDPLERLWATLARSDEKNMAIDEILGSLRSRPAPARSTGPALDHRRSALERRIDDVLGKAGPHAEVATPQLPDTGIAGPDLGW
jgi:conjugative relaxase-like TrwC/TraI family protein